MNNNKIGQALILVIAGAIIIPIAYNATVGILNATIKSTVNTINWVNKVKFDKKIRKGLKDGSIIEIDGEYYDLKDLDLEKLIEAGENA